MNTVQSAAIESAAGRRPAERFLSGRRAGGAGRRRDRAGGQPPRPPISRMSIADPGLAPAGPRVVRQRPSRAGGRSTRSSSITARKSCGRTIACRARAGAAFHPGLDMPHAELVLRKGFHPAIDSYSAFRENDRKTPTGLAGYLRERGSRPGRRLCGLATDFCVLYSALDARAAGFDDRRRARGLPRHRPRRLARKGARRDACGRRRDLSRPGAIRLYLGGGSMPAAQRPALDDELPAAAAGAGGRAAARRSSRRGCGALEGGRRAGGPRRACAPAFRSAAPRCASLRAVSRGGRRSPLLAARSVAMSTQPWRSRTPVVGSRAISALSTMPYGSKASASRSSGRSGGRLATNTFP